MSTIRKQLKEAVLFINEQFCQLRYSNIVPGSLVLYRVIRNNNVQNQSKSGKMTSYEQIDAQRHRDYKLNESKGEISRSVESTLPNWANHALYGRVPFDHTLFPDYSNEPYTLYVDYEYEVDIGQSLIINKQSTIHNRRLVEKINENPCLHYAVLGDSISTGAEASDPSHAYFTLLADYLEQQFSVTVKLTNKAIGGETSTEGLERITHDILPLQPHIVTIGYGMNDQNLFEIGLAVTVEQFKCNMLEMANKVLSETNAIPILIAGCLPNPKWVHSSGQAHRFAEAIRQVGDELDIPVVDVHQLWCEVLEAGKTPESLLLNNINHPNNYGHQLYFEAFKQLLE